jgi:hypothetical protein
MGLSQRIPWVQRLAGACCGEGGMTLANGKSLKKKLLRGRLLHKCLLTWGLDSCKKAKTLKPKRLVLPAFLIRKFWRGRPSVSSETVSGEKTITSPTKDSLRAIHTFFTLREEN